MALSTEAKKKINFKGMRGRTKLPPLSHLTTTPFPTHSGRATNVWPICSVDNLNVRYGTQVTFSADYATIKALDELRRLIPPQYHSSQLNDSVLVKVALCRLAAEAGSNKHPIIPVVLWAQKVFTSFGIKLFGNYFAEAQAEPVSLNELAKAPVVKA